MLHVQNSTLASHLSTLASKIYCVYDMKKREGTQEKWLQVVDKFMGAA